LTTLLFAEAEKREAYEAVNSQIWSRNLDHAHLWAILNQSINQYLFIKAWQNAVMQARTVRTNTI